MVVFIAVPPVVGAGIRQGAGAWRGGATELRATRSAGATPGPRNSRSPSTPCSRSAAGPAVPGCPRVSMDTLAPGCSRGWQSSRKVHVRSPKARRSLDQRRPGIVPGEGLPADRRLPGYCACHAGAGPTKTHDQHCTAVRPMSHGLRQHADLPGKLHHRKPQPHIRTLPRPWVTAGRASWRHGRPMPATSRCQLQLVARWPARARDDSPACMPLMQVLAGREPLNEFLFEH
jgi:hypothetical protein